LISENVDGIPHVYVSLFNKKNVLIMSKRYPKWKVSIYIMNDNGRTIDSYEWNGCLSPYEKPVLTPQDIKVRKQGKRLLISRACDVEAIETVIGKLKSLIYIKVEEK